jgi:ribosomal protein L13E
MEGEKIEHILKTIREIQAVSIQPVKMRLGEGFSYGEIRAVMSHLHFVERMGT